MTKRLAIAIPLLFAATTSWAQTNGLFGGDLPAQAVKNIETKALGLHNQGASRSLADLTEYFSEQELEILLDGAVAKLTLLPDGSFVAAVRDGGTLSSFKLGRAQVATESFAPQDADWRVSSGEYAQPKRPQKVALTVAAAGREMTVSCANKFGKSDAAITFYVGPLRGLNCIGVAEEIELPSAASEASGERIAAAGN